MDGVGSGGVYGEVTEQHLTIRKADKQRVSHRFGEVLTFSRRNHSRGRLTVLRDSQQCCRRWLLTLPEMASDLVADGS